MTKPYGFILIWITILLLACQEDETQKTNSTRNLLTENINIKFSAEFDTANVNLLIENSRQKIKNSDSSSYEDLKTALKISKQQNYHLGMANSLYGLASYHQKFDKSTDDIIPYLERALAEFNYAGNIEGILLTKRNLLNYYFYKGHYQYSIDAFNRYSISQNRILEENMAMWGNLNMEVARSFFKLGKYDSSLYHYQRAIHHLENHTKENYEALIESYIGVGIVWARLKDLNQALVYFDKSIFISKAYDDSITLAFSLINKGSAYFDEDNLDTSNAIFQKALDISRIKGSFNLQSSSEAAISRILLREGKFQEALVMGKSALKNATKSGFFNEIVDAYLVLGEVYIALDQYHSAIKILNTGLLLAKSRKQLDDLSSFYEQLAFANFRLNNFKEAYEFETKYVKLKDSLIGNENTTLIAEINAKYQISQKDKELFERKLQIEKQKKEQYIWIGIAVLLIVFLLSLLYRKKQKTYIGKLKANLEGEEKERARLAKELHDGIVSQLSVIKTNLSALPQYKKQRSEDLEFQDALGQLDQTIAELRTTSHNLLPEILKKAGLIESIRIYCNHVNDSKELTITFQVINKLPILSDEFQLNIYRIIQEIIQNIAKHANAKQVLIQFLINKNILEITIDDDGTNPLTYEIMAKGKENGIGLHNLKTRIVLLEGTIEIEHHKGTSIYLVFNFKKFKVNE